MTLFLPTAFRRAEDVVGGAAVVVVHVAVAVVHADASGALVHLDILGLEISKLVRCNSLSKLSYDLHQNVSLWPWLQ